MAAFRIAYICRKDSKDGSAFIELLWQKKYAIFFSFTRRGYWKQIPCYHKMSISYDSSNKSKQQRQYAEINPHEHRFSDGLPLFSMGGGATFRSLCSLFLCRQSVVAVAAMMTDDLMQRK